jgi:pimeloyl-ACP methyl ester carboxylesterase
VASAGGYLETVFITGATGPPLVFLHEGLGSVELWRGFPDAVRQACGDPPTLVYSRHGYGHSAPARLPRAVDFMHHEADVVLPEVLARFGLRSPVLVGHSDGASIALLHAGAGFPVAALALIAPHVFVEDVTVASIEDARNAFSAGDLRARLGRYHDDVDATFRGWSDVWLSAGFRSWNIEGCLRAITCPVLVVQGDADPYGTLAQLDEIESKVRGPVTRLVVEGAGHAPHLEATERVVSAIGELVATVRLERAI